MDYCSCKAPGATPSGTCSELARGAQSEKEEEEEEKEVEEKKEEGSRAMSARSISNTHIRARTHTQRGRRAGA